MVRFYLQDIYSATKSHKQFRLKCIFPLVIIATALPFFFSLFALSHMFMCHDTGLFIASNFFCAYDFYSPFLRVWSDGFYNYNLDTIQRIGELHNKLPDGAYTNILVSLSPNWATWVLWLLLLLNMITYALFIPQAIDPSEIAEIERQGFEEPESNFSAANEAVLFLLLLNTSPFLVSFFYAWIIIIPPALSGEVPYTATIFHFFPALLLLLLPYAGLYNFKRMYLGAFSEHTENEIYQRVINKKSFLELEESLFLEFKASFQSSYPNAPQKNTDDKGRAFYTIGGKQRFRSEKEIQRLLQDMVLEAIVGFLNASGGKLVIGVHEKDNVKEIVGIEYENFGSEDEYERHVIQHIINRIGMPFMGDYITTGFEEIDGKKLFIINIKAFVPRDGQIPALLDGVNCFRRTGPRTDEILPGADFAKFVADRMRQK